MEIGEIVVGRRLSGFWIVENNNSDGTYVSIRRVAGSGGKLRKETNIAIVPLDNIVKVSEVIENIQRSHNVSV